MSKWYYAVTDNILKIPDCIKYYETELCNSKVELSLQAGKTIEKHASELPSLVDNRFGQLQEIEAILEYLNIELKKKRSRAFRKLLEGYKRALSSRDAEKYVDGEQEVVDFTLIVNEFALLRNQYLSLHKGLDSKNWMIGHITKLRCAGLEDSRV